MTITSGRCLYCSAEYEPRPLPHDCPTCGRALGKTMGPETTFRDVVTIAARAGKQVHLTVQPDLLPGLAGILFEVEDGGGWGGFVRHDGAPLTAEDEARIADQPERHPADCACSLCRLADTGGA